MSAKNMSHASADHTGLANVVTDQAGEIARSAGFKAKIYQAISIQRPVVLEYLRSLRREKPNASAAEILKELEKRYVTTVTATSTGVGASAAIPGVGIPIALGLGVADLLFFYETSALYILAVTELHGIEVTDAERARPLIFGVLLGQRSQSRVTRIVLQASGAGGVDTARTVATGTARKLLPRGWGEVLTQQLPDSAIAPVATVLAREAMKNSALLGAGTLGKALPFGVGAVIGGVGSFTFGRDVVKAAHIAFPNAPLGFPNALTSFKKADRDSREARALTATKRAGSALKGAATGTASVVGSLFKRKRKMEIDVNPGPHQSAVSVGTNSEI